MTVDVLGNQRIAIVRRDVSLPLPFDVTHAQTSERALFRGYSGGGELPRIAARPCVCGGLIDPGDELAIAATVAHNNAERRHAAWRERQG